MPISLPQYVTITAIVAECTNTATAPVVHTGGKQDKQTNIALKKVNKIWTQNHKTNMQKQRTNKH